MKKAAEIVNFCMGAMKNWMYVNKQRLSSEKTDNSGQQRDSLFWTELHTFGKISFVASRWFQNLF